MSGLFIITYRFKDCLTGWLAQREVLQNTHMDRAIWLIVWTARASTRGLIEDVRAPAQSNRHVCFFGSCQISSILQIESRFEIGNVCIIGSELMFRILPRKESRTSFVKLKWRFIKRETKCFKCLKYVTYTVPPSNVQQIWLCVKVSYNISRFKFRK